MRRSFVDVPANSHFPLQNLPYGVFSVGSERPHIAVAIGELVLDLTRLQKSQLLPGDYFQSSSLNAFLQTGAAEWRKIRGILQSLLDENNSTLRDDAALRKEVLIPQNLVKMHLPVDIGDYTDFYSSKEHATNVGSMFRDPQNALLPNWTHLPVAYHGRSSSIVISGTPIYRPCGQSKAENKPLPSFGPSKFMDFELEVGCIVGKGNELGIPIPVHNAIEHIFGMVLVNDWSARDLQSWEYVPLGPFLGKNLGTSISPWVVTMEALEEFRVDGPLQEPPPLPYLQIDGAWSYDIELEARIQTASSSTSEVITKGNFRSMYWNICQQVAHHTSNGCNLRVGDLLASGTISGKDPASYGSMLELTWRGANPLKLSCGDIRSSLQDGDTLSLSGWGNGNGYKIGFGEVNGRIEPARVEETLLVSR